jgi:DNA-binding beta-propeller fold protein YncE
MLFRAGDFVYRYRNDWIRWPGHISDHTVSGLFIAPNGNLYVTTRNHYHPFLVFDQNGNFLRSFGQEIGFKGTHGPFISQAGEVWVCDTGRSIALVLDMDGHVLRTYGRQNQPSDTGYDPKVPYPRNMATIARLGEPFNRPTRMMPAPNGDLYCTDGYGNAAVHHFDKDGHLLHSWGGPGREAGQFCLPHSLWIDPNGHVWVADRDNYRVQVFTGEGALIRSFENMYNTNHPRGPADLWGDGQYVYASLQYGGVAVFDFTPEWIATIGMDLMLPMGHSLCGDAQGNLYVGMLNTEETVLRLERLQSAQRA